ncbi:MAG: hypothetical protein KM310_10640 [Clostridiales bacterium]|nr:hypothetical protein [Clostridiales bacterium]
MAVEKKTIAEQVAEALGGNGKDFSRWDEVMVLYPHRVTQVLHRPPVWKYEFFDDSALVVTESYWDTEDGFLSRTNILKVLRDTGRVREEDLFAFAWDWLRFASNFDDWEEVRADEFVLSVMTAYKKGMSAEEWKHWHISHSGRLLTGRIPDSAFRDPRFTEDWERWRASYTKRIRSYWEHELDAVEEILRAQGLWPWEEEGETRE